MRFELRSNSKMPIKCTNVFNKYSSITQKNCLFQFFVKNSLNFPGLLQKFLDLILTGESAPISSRFPAVKLGIMDMPCEI